MRFSHNVLLGILGAALVAGAVADLPNTGRTLSDLGDRIDDLERGGGSREVGDATVGGGYVIGDRNGAIGGYVERDGEYRGVVGVDVGDKTVGVRGSLGDDGLHLKKMGGRRLSGLDLERGGGSREVGDATVGGGYVIGDRNGAIGGYVERDGEYRGVVGVDVGDKTVGVRGSLGDDGLHLKKMGGRRLSGLDLERGGGSREVGDATVGGGYVIGDRNGAIGGYVERGGEYRGVVGVDVGDKTVGVRGSLGDDGLHLKKMGGRRLSGLDLERGGGSREVGDATVGGGYVIGDRNGAIGGYVERDGEYRGVVGVDVGDKTVGVRGSLGDDGLHLKKMGGRRLSGLALERGGGSRKVGDATVGGGYVIGDRNGAIGGYVERDGEYRGVVGVDVGDKTVGVRGSLGDDGLHLKKMGGN